MSISKNNKIQTLGIIGNTIGFCVLLGIVSIFTFIFINIVIFGGIILYEPNKFISTVETVLIIIGFIFLVYLFKKKLWDDKF